MSSDKMNGEQTSVTVADTSPRATAAIACPPSGKWISFLETAEESGGQWLRFEMWLAPSGASHGPIRHVHPKQDEILEVREGVMGYWYEGKKESLEPGESVTIPAGEPHTFWNASHDELHLVGEVRPALQTEEFMRILYGLARDGYTNKHGLPYNPLRLAPILERYDDMLYLSYVPEWFQRTGVQLLAPLGRVVGYSHDYSEYSDE